MDGKATSQADSASKAGARDTSRILSKGLVSVQWDPIKRGIETVSRWVVWPPFTKQLARRVASVMCSAFLMPACLMAMPSINTNAQQPISELES